MQTTQRTVAVQAGSDFNGAWISRWEKLMTLNLAMELVGYWAQIHIGAFGKHKEQCQQ